MDEFITYIWDATHWQWWAVATVLLASEVLLPTFFLLWPGLAAIITGMVVYLSPDMDWRYQIIFFTVVAVVTTLLGRRYFSPNSTPTDTPDLNERDVSLKGRKMTLKTDMVDGRGRVDLDDGSWIAVYQEGETLKKGSRVEIVGVDGASILVKPIK